MERFLVSRFPMALAQSRPKLVFRRSRVFTDVDSVIATRNVDRASGCCPSEFHSRFTLYRDEVRSPATR